MSEEEDEEEEEEESEEELLALSRDGWVCGSAAGFSATGNKCRQSGSCCACSDSQSRIKVCKNELKHIN